MALDGASSYPSAKWQAEPMLVWADIENEPQVQYLLPLLEACRRMGAETLLTARDSGATFELLSGRGIRYQAVGAAYGASKPAKILGLASRARALSALLRKEGVPDVLVCASRAAVLAARWIRVPSFVVSDYEHANLTLFRWSGSTIMFPDVIDESVYRSAGISPQRVFAFRGLKEDLTFAGVDLDTIERTSLGADGHMRVLVRPPAEESHYYARRSRELYLAALRWVAAKDEAVIVLSPRYARQRDDLIGLRPANEPIVLEHPLPFLTLLRSVDAVLTSGGTMLREAAYLGVPAYSLFGSRLGAVDRHLAAIGRATLLSSEDDITELRLEHSRGFSPLDSNPRLADELAGLVMSGAPEKRPTSIA
jgi:predicted glycosyltransferase